MTGLAICLAVAAVVGGVAGWLAGLLAAWIIRWQARSDRACLTALAGFERSETETARRVGGRFDA